MLEYLSTELIDIRLYNIDVEKGWNMTPNYLSSISSLSLNKINISWHIDDKSLTADSF